LNQKNQQFESLVRSYYQSLFRYAYWQCKDKQVAEDLVQETFAKAWKNIGQLQNLESAKAWLFTIINRENSRRFAKKQLPIKEFTDEWTIEDIADNDRSLEAIPLQRAIKKLPIEYREPLILQIVAGFTTNEISSIMKLNSNTVSTRLHRARSVLKKIMSPTVSKGGFQRG